MSEKKEVYEDVLKRLANTQGALGPLVTALAALDVSSLQGAERKSLISAILRFAESKNGPSLMMAVSPSIQAMISFSGATLPGLDRLAPLKASPRVVLSRLLDVEDEFLLGKYAFEKIGKEDRAYYLKSCKTPIAPCKKFLEKEPSAGGFTDEEIGELVVSNKKLLSVVPVSRIPPDRAVDILVADKRSGLWKLYDFSRLGKALWRTILSRLNPKTVPAACKKYLANADGNGFSQDELLELAATSDVALDWLNPESVPFAKAYAFKLSGRGEKLWAKYPFEKVSRFNWIRLIEDKKLPIPMQFSQRVADGTFVVGDLCGLAKKNRDVIDFLPLDKLSPVEMIDLLIATNSSALWERYDFRRLSAQDWTSLICSSRDVLPIRQLQMLKTVQGWSADMVCAIVNHDSCYYTHLSIELIPTDIVVDLLLAGKAQELWKSYHFNRLNKEDWLRLLAVRTVKIPSVFARVAEGDMFTTSELVKLAVENHAVVSMLPLTRLSTGQVVGLLISLDDDHLWAKYDFARLKCADWIKLISGRVGVLPERALSFLKAPPDIDAEFVEKIIRYNSRYCEYVPHQLIPTHLVVDLLLGSESRYLWKAYKDFDRLTPADWIRLLENLKGAVPQQCKTYLASASCGIPDRDLNRLVLKRMEYAEYVKPSRITTEVALKVLLSQASSVLWTSFGFSRFSKAEKRELLMKGGVRGDWPVVLLSMLSDGSDALTDSELCELAKSNPLTFVRHIGKSRLAGMSDKAFAAACKNFSWQNAAVDEVAAVLQRSASPAARNWEGLSRPKELILLKEIPSLRSAVRWQEFSNAEIQILIAANPVFWTELKQPQKFYYFVWRHWIAILFVLAVTAAAIICVCANIREQHRLRAAAERRDQIVARIQSLNGSRQYAALSRYMNSLEGEDAEALKDSRTQSADAAVRRWQQRLREEQTLLRELSALADRSWPVASASRARELISSLSSHWAMEPAEVADYERLERGFRNVEHNRHYRDELGRISGQIDRCLSVSSVASLLADVGSIQNNAVSDDTTRSKCKEVVLHAKEKMCALSMVELKTISDSAAKASGLEELMRLAVKVNVVLQGDPRAINDSVKNKGKQILQVLETKAESIQLKELASLESRAGKTDKIDGLSPIERGVIDIQNAAIASSKVANRCAEVQRAIVARRSLLERRAQEEAVAIMSKEVSEVESRLDKCSSQEDLDWIKAAVRNIEKRRYFAAYKKANAMKWDRVTGLLSSMDAGIASADNLIRRCSSIEGRYTSRFVDEIAVTKHYDVDVGEWRFGPKKILERTANGGFRKIAGVDYSNIQGVALFVCNDLDRAIPDEWVAGRENPRHPHWFASSKPGQWKVEPGYETVGMFASQLSEVRWTAGKKYDGGDYRTGSYPGEWEYRGVCSVCSGAGYTTYQYLSHKCGRCDGTGKIWVKGNYGYKNPVRCPSCKGDPKVYATGRRPCATCNGIGNAWRTLSAKEAAELVSRLKRNE